MIVGSYIPKEIINIILEYDGRIKYRKGEYINIIHKNDERYNIIQIVISKKNKIMKKIELSGTSFYFEFSFNIDSGIGLCYDYNFSYENKFEICYYDIRTSLEQIRTYI